MRGRAAGVRPPADGEAYAIAHETNIAYTPMFGAGFRDGALLNMCMHR